MYDANELLLLMVIQLGANTTLMQQVVSGVKVACTNTGVLFNYIDAGKLLIGRHSLD